MTIGPNIAPLYFVEVSLGRPRMEFINGELTKLGGRVFLETDRNTNSREQVIRDIASGQISNVERVLEIFEDEGSCRDITDDIRVDVREYLYRESEHVPVNLREFVAEAGVSA